MASIKEELWFAKQAKAAIEGKLTERATEGLREAHRMAGTQPAFSDALRDARHKVKLALLLVIIGLEQRQKNRGDRDKAKSAIEDWIKELERSL
jgi:hypothetical protein